MPTNAEYEATIQRCGWAELRTLWERIRSRATSPEWESGRALEYLVVRAFQLNDADVRWPYSVRAESGEELEQIDGTVHIRGISFLAESKDYEGDVPVAPIAKLRSQLVRRPLGTYGVVFSRTGFTDSARTLTQFTSPQNILLWPGHEIEIALRRGNFYEILDLKIRRCIELALPDYDVRLEFGT